MDRWVGKVALVTGASVGIGAAIAKALVREGMIVVGCARNVEQIQAIQTQLEAESAKGKLHPIKCDLIKKEEIAAMFDVIQKEHKVVHVCINNAGLAVDAPLVKGDPDGWQTMIDVNVMALCRCTQESLKLMKKAGVDDGQIIHMNSMSGHRLSGNNVYSATKCMVTALTEGLRRELRAMKSNVRVSSISPGLVETELVARMRGEDPETCTFFKNNASLQPEDIAEQVLHILKQPAHIQIHDLLLRPTTQSM